MKRVILIAPLPPPYGGISHWTAMVQQHSLLAENIPLIVVDTAPRHATIFDESFYRRVIKGVPRLIGQFRQVVRLLRPQEVIAVHVTSAGHFGVVRDISMLWLARLFKRRSVLHIRFGRVPALLNSKGLMSGVVRFCLHSATHVIAIDSQTASAIRDKLPSVPVSQVPNCIDLSALPEIPERKSQTVVFVGWVLPSKGIEDLLEAWEKIASSDWRLKIIGPYSPDYISQLAEKFDVDEVEFSGEQENSEVLSQIAGASILCLPSHTEGFPNVILEAMALRCAIVATPVGAIPEMLQGGAGVIVSTRDPAALSQALISLMDDLPARVKISGSAYSRVKREYAIDKVYRTYEAVWTGR